MSEIFSSELKDRTGINKFVASLPVFYYGIAVTLITAYICKNREGTRRYLIKPMLIAMIFVATVALIEFGAWFSGAFFTLYDVLSHILRSGRWPSFTIGRLQSITFEPSVLGLYLGFSLVVLRLAIAITESRQKKLRYKIIFAGIILLMILCNARTASVLLVGMTMGHFMIRWIVNTDKRFQRVLLFVFAPIAIIVAVLGIVALHDLFVSSILAGESVSNLSRYASNTAAFTLFYQNPVFGVGFGQYAFRAFDILPSWAWQSYEIDNWFNDPDFTWPAVYSLPLRIAAETGLFGLLSWYGTLVLICSRLLNAIKKEAKGSDGEKAGKALLWGMTYIFLSGVSYDSFRNFAVWIILGLVFAFLGNWNRLNLKSKNL
jgi:O-antigen ligase